jgi:hypothetical protein
MSLVSDCLRAVAGIFPKKVDASDLQKGAKLPQTFERRLKAWIAADEIKPFVYVEPPKDMEELFTRLVGRPGQLETEAWFHGIGVDDPDLPADFLSGTVAARVYLVGDLMTGETGIWPTLSLDTAAGPEPLPLAADDAGDMAAVYRILDDPASLLDEMEQYTLEPAQATAFRENFPDLYNFVGTTLQQAIAGKRAKDTKWLPSWQQEGVLRVLKGMPPEEQFTAPPPPAPGNPKLDLNAEKMATQGQLAEQPVGRENPTGA